MILRCAIIDDDKVFTDIMSYYISKVDFLELKGIYHDASGAYSNLNLEEVDFIFLDVEMPEINGIEFLDCLPSSPPVIFVSRKKEYGADAFEYESIDYLTKPVSFTRFLKAVNKAKKYFEQAGAHHELHPDGHSENDGIFIRHDRMWIRVPYKDILYIKADNNDVIIKTNDTIYKSHIKLKDICDQLPNTNFLQVHRSFVVQLSKIDKVDGEIIEINSKTIPVSKTYMKELYHRLNIT